MKKDIDLNDINIIQCIVINNKINLDYYSTYYEYQKELRTIDKDLDNPIETELECINHMQNYDGYTDNIIYYKNQKVGLLSYQNIDWLDDGKPPLIYIDHLYINPEYRHTGVAKAAVNKLVKSYPEHTFYLYALISNSVANKFWDGFIRTCEDPKLTYTRDARCRIDNEQLANKICYKYIFRKN